MIDAVALLAQAGVDITHVGPKEIKGRCPNPLHDDRKPSWSISRTTYLHHCFSCGYSGTLTALLVDLTGAAPVDLEDTLKTQSFLRTMEEVRRHPDEVLEPVLPLLTDWHIKHVLADVPEKLLLFRRLRRFAADVFEVRWQPETREWVLPLRDPTGSLLGAQYRQVGTVLTLPGGLPKSSTLFGYRQMRQHDQCVLVESPLDAVRLFGLGIPALASLGAWVSREQVTLMARCFAVVYLALDDDKAGHEGAEVATKMLRREGCAVVPWRYEGLTDEDGAPVKDVGDVEDDEALVNAWERTRRWGL